MGALQVRRSSQWEERSIEITPEKGVYPLYLRYDGDGAAEILQISFAAKT